MKRQTGFTLIELAIVLVIIGLLLGGVLKGQELINSAKAKSIAADLKNVQVFLYGYQDKFRALPGDDANASSHINNATNATTGGAARGDAIIGGSWDSTTVTDESYLFWQHVRLAGLATGSTVVGNADYIPRNADGGQIGIQSVSTFTTITNMPSSFVVCTDNILGRLAKQIDANLDDGDTSTGAVRAVVKGAPGAGVALATVVDSTAYTVCLAF